MRYALDVQYAGKNYAGSQIQYENGEQIKEPTIQGELERALSTLIKSYKRCEIRKDLQKCKALEDETLRARRCDRSDSEGNEAISDCTGGKNVNRCEIRKDRNKFYLFNIQKVRDLFSDFLIRYYFFIEII